MSYSKAIRKRTIANRILVSWAIIFVVALVIGALIGRVLTHSTTSGSEETLIYGRYDGKIFTGEMQEYKRTEEFTPLDVPLDKDVQEFTYYLADAYDLDFTFVMAIIQTESSFDEDCVSETGDWGLMQINEANQQYLTEELGIKNFIDPYDNIRGGVFILRKLFEKYESPEKVLMAYSIGESGAVKLWDQGIFETNYSNTVLKYQQSFNAELERSKK